MVLLIYKIQIKNPKYISDNGLKKRKLFILAITKIQVLKHNHYD